MRNFNGLSNIQFALLFGAFKTQEMEREFDSNVGEEVDELHAILEIEKQKRGEALILTLCNDFELYSIKGE